MIFNGGSGSPRTPGTQLKLSPCGLSPSLATSLSLSSQSERTLESIQQMQWRLQLCDSRLSDKVQLEEQFSKCHVGNLSLNCMLASRPGSQASATDILEVNLRLVYYELSICGSVS